MAKLPEFYQETTYRSLDPRPSVRYGLSGMEGFSTAGDAIRYILQKGIDFDMQRHPVMYVRSGAPGGLEITIRERFGVEDKEMHHLAKEMLVRERESLLAYSP